MIDAKDTMTGVLGQVFESMAFMFVTPMEKEEYDCNDVGSPIEVRLRFEGPSKGEMAMVVPEAMCEEIAANILGTDPGDEAATEQAIDSLKEVLNVVCGNVLTQVAGEKAVFNLQVPESNRLSDEQVGIWYDGPETLFVSVDDHPVMFHYLTSG